MKNTCNLKASIPLNVDVRPEDGAIEEVGTHRHRVRWVDDGLSSITYCNNCGSTFIVERAEVDYCGECDVELPV